MATTLAPDNKVTKTFDKLSKQDLQAMILLFELAFCSEKGESWTRRQILDFIREGTPDKIFAIVYDEEGKLVAFASCYKLKPGILPESVSLAESPYYNDVDVVSPACRGSGIGTKLLQMRVDHLYDNNLTDSLLVRFRADNFPVQAVYKKLGFEKLHRYQLSYHGVDSERIISGANIEKLHSKYHPEQEAHHKPREVASLVKGNSSLPHDHIPRDAAAIAAGLSSRGFGANL